MAVKTITIDLEAYETLVRARRGNESFSTVIKESLGSSTRTAARLLAHLEGMTVDEGLLDDMDRVLDAREDDWIAAEPESS